MAEVASITIDEARELVADQAIWPRVRDFLWDFAPQIHESWLEGLDKLELLEQRAQASGLVNLDSPRVKKFILDSLNIGPCFHSFPKDDWSRLLLLDAETLDSIAKWLGALACADSLRKVMGGAAVRELKAALPGVYPEVFGFTAYFKGLESWKLEGPEGEHLGEKVVSQGYAMLFSAVADLPEPLPNRFLLKLQKDQASKLSGRDAPNFQTSKPQLLQLLQKLLKLRFPEAYKLCC